MLDLEVYARLAACSRPHTGGIFGSRAGIAGDIGCDIHVDVAQWPMPGPAQLLLLESTWGIARGHMPSRAPCSGGQHILPSVLTKEQGWSLEQDPGTTRVGCALWSGDGAQNRAWAMHSINERDLLEVGQFLGFSRWIVLFFGDINSNRILCGLARVPTASLNKLSQRRPDG